MGFHLHGKTNPHAPCSSRKGTRNSLSLEKQMLCACTSQGGIAGIAVSEGIYCGSCGNLPLERGSGCFIDSPVSLDCQMVPVIAHPVAQLCLTSTEGALLKVL